MLSDLDQDSVRNILTAVVVIIAPVAGHFDIGVIMPHSVGSNARGEALHGQRES